MKAYIEFEDSTKLNLWLKDNPKIKIVSTCMACFPFHLGMHSLGMKTVTGIFYEQKGKKKAKPYDIVKDFTVSPERLKQIRKKREIPNIRA